MWSSDLRARADLEAGDTSLAHSPSDERMLALEFLGHTDPLEMPRSDVSQSQWYPSRGLCVNANVVVVADTPSLDSHDHARALRYTNAFTGGFPWLVTNPANASESRSETVRW